MEGYEWLAKVICLDKLSKRYQKFNVNNIHLKHKFFQGISGKDLNKEEVLKAGLLSKSLLDSNLVSDGAIGCAASHRALWNEVITTKKPMLILEDDVITHENITHFINDNYRQLMEIDITFFTINTNTILQSISPEGMETVTMFRYLHPSEDWIKKTLLNTRLAAVRPHKLIKAFGHAAYFITPIGAKKMEEKTFPLEGTTVNIPKINEKLLSVAHDIEANRFYHELDAYICLPFLAFSPNINSTTNLKNIITEV
tara:strand:- start:723 stop:1487 length:765 start_codon:yes stop_codon:yes gene_type:complete